MAVTNLACRECGTEYELTAQYVCSKCFGPLEVKYDHSALADDVDVRRVRLDDVRDAVRLGAGSATQRRAGQPRHGD